MEGERRGPRGRAASRGRGPSLPEEQVEQPEQQSGTGSPSSTNAPRGRARGRARGVPAGLEQPQRPESPTALLAAVRFEDGQPSEPSSTETATGAGAEPGALVARGRARDFARDRDYIVTKPADVNKTVNLEQSGCAPVKLITNYYRINRVETLSWCLYNIKIVPQVEHNFLIRKIIGSQRERLGAFLRTGLQIFVTKELSPEEANFVATITTREIPEGTQYQVTLELVRHVGDFEIEVTLFHHNVSRKILDALGYKLLGRHFYDPTSGRGLERHHLAMWPGFQNTIRDHEVGTLLNVESVWKVVQTDNMWNQMLEIQSKNKANYKEVTESSMIGLNVVTPHNFKCYKITAIDWASTPTTTFPKNGAQVSFVDYYKIAYGIQIKNLAQPLFNVQPSEKQRRVGNVNIKLIPEHCIHAGITDKIRNDFTAVKAMKDILFSSADERVSTMQKLINRMTTDEKVAELLRSWGSLESTPVSVTGRLLREEKILMGKGTSTQVEAKDCEFVKGVRSNPMLTTVELKSWALVVTKRDKEVAEHQLVSAMQAVAGPMKFAISKPTIVAVADAKSLANGVDQAYNQLKGQPQMIMILLQSAQTDIYAAVKKRCSLNYGVPSQCMLHKNTDAKKIKSICTKMVIQMNAKLGGEPWGVVNPLQKKKIMVVGYDVYHAGLGGGKSVAAMTATTSSLGRYTSCTKMTNPGVEIETVVASLFQTCLTAYKAQTGVLPEWIIMYRDGVGEGQLFDVYNLELKALKRRIEETYVGSEPPKLCYVVVNKRITTRFFRLSRLSNPATGAKQYENPPVGTVVDDVVTRVERYDFFLVSQRARQGCVSPTYYNVLADEMNMGAERIQKFTFKMCHMYYNWTGPVSVPAPCQNAHKLAFQIGTALNEQANASLSHLLHFL